jgi:hypothetical protein
VHLAGWLAAVGVLTIPDIASEGVEFVNRLQSDNIWVVLVEKMRAGLGWVGRQALATMQPYITGS